MVLKRPIVISKRDDGIDKAELLIRESRDRTSQEPIRTQTHLIDRKLGPRRR